jgi:predicted RNase H-like nuclease (RuvC/YqgF family)
MSDTPATEFQPSPPKRTFGSGYKRLQARTKHERAAYQEEIARLNRENSFLKLELEELKASNMEAETEAARFLQDYERMKRDNQGGWGTAADATLNQLERQPDVRSVQICAATLARLQLRLATIAQQVTM